MMLRTYLNLTTLATYRVGRVFLLLALLSHERGVSYIISIGGEMWMSIYRPFVKSYIPARTRFTYFSGL